MRTLLTINEVCRKLSVDQTWFRRSDNRRRLKALGFPDQVPGLGKRWDPRAIDIWLDKVGGLQAETKIEGASIELALTDDEIAASQATLRERLERMGAPRQ